MESVGNDTRVIPRSGVGEHVAAPSRRAPPRSVMDAPAASTDGLPPRAGPPTPAPGPAPAHPGPGRPPPAPRPGDPRCRAAVVEVRGCQGTGDPRALRHVRHAV